LLLFGGNYLIDRSDKFLSDAYLINVKTNESKKIELVASSKQKKSLARGHHSLVKSGGALWLFGGEHHRLRLSDTWQFELVGENS